MVLAPDTIQTLGTRSRILDAAFHAVATFGLSRLTVDDVAREASLSRQTVYRYFASKDDLIVAMVFREEEAFLEGVREAHARYEDLEEALREAVLFCFRTAREHPLLGRLLASEPEVLLPYLTTRGAGLVARAREVVEDLAASRDEVRAEVVHGAADLAVRAIVSYSITPSDDPPEDVATGLAHILACALREEERT